MKNVLRLVGWVVLALAGLVALGLALCLAPVDDTPYQKTAFYRLTRQRLAQLPPPPAPTAPLRAGWANVNCTPAAPTPTAGYGVRRGQRWKTVHDSVYVRAIALDNGSVRAAVVSLDLLIAPPTVVEQLKKRLPEVGLRWENVLLGAIHSHNAPGGWAPNWVGELLAGDYDPARVAQLTEAVLRAIRLAQQNMAPVRVHYGEAARADLLHNRISPTGSLDPYVRVLTLQRPGTGDRAVLTTFSGHATLLDARRGADYLSRDWPGVLVDQLEARGGTFAQFMAGAVGSMGPNVVNRDLFDATTYYGRQVAATAGNVVDSLAGATTFRRTTLPAEPTDSALAVLTLPLALREPTARVADGWRIRPGIFYTAYGNYPAELKALRIGNVVLLGTPCDFSGELVAPLAGVARQRGLHLMVTSFNGGYVGYITPDHYYHQNTYESRDMNWFGPGNGAYFSELMAGLLRKI